MVSFVTTLDSKVSINSSTELHQIGEFDQNKAFQGNFVQLGPKFVSGQEMAVTPNSIPELISKEILQLKVNKVYQTTKKHDYDVNGFEFHDFSNTVLGKAITKIATGPKKYEEIPQENFDIHAKAVVDALTDWAKVKKIPFKEIVWIDTVYRNTEEGKFGPVHFVHCDFPEEDYSQTLKGHDTWIERVAEKLGPLTKEEYEKLPVERIMNIWMPLNDVLEAEPLALMDIQSLKKTTDLKVYQDKRTMGGGQYPSVGVYQSDDHKWYIKDGMKRGEAVVFDSCKTPHTAVTLPNQGSKTRRSLECRVLFLK